MTMTMRDRILAVYRGETPDMVPYMLDLSHYFYHKNQKPWDLSQSYEEPEYDLIDYHKKMGAGFYVPNLGSFFSTTYANDVTSEVEKVVVDGCPEITWRYTTPIGPIERTRIWHNETYSWAIKNWSIKTGQDLKVLGYAMGNRSFTPNWDKYNAWVDYAGDIGVVYLPLGYSAMGYLLNYWMGIEGVMYATFDWPDTMHEVIDQINATNLNLVDLLCTSPAEVIVMGDNFSSDIQPPHFFEQWSRPFYVEAIKRLHDAGKYVAVHIDGKLQNAIKMIRDAGADAADAVTPPPMGDLTPVQCREEAGPDFILSGGVSPDLWLPENDVDDFKQAVIDWLELKKHGPRFIANAGDQVPPGACEDRIEIMRDLVEEHGKY
jgi:Uroporphyrinogen decarboxylase (URO-D)